MNNKFSENMKKLRLERKITQSELAKAIGVSPSTVGMYETGEREPNFETEEKIADFFNVSLDYLRGKKENTPADSAKEAANKILKGQIYLLNQRNQALLMTYYQALLDTQENEPQESISNKDLKDRLGGN